MATADGYASANAATKPKCIIKTSPLAVCSPVDACQKEESLVLKISQNSNNIYMNKKRPTPETDAAWAAWPYAGPGVHANFARKLERERDEACVELRKLRIENNHNWQAIEFAEEAVKERDESLVALREAWLAMDELVDVPDRIINWQNKYSHILEETK